MNAQPENRTIRERIEHSRALGRDMRRAREEAVQQLRAVAESLRRRNGSRTFKPLP